MSQTESDGPRGDPGGAFFDVDGTLLPGTSMEKLLVKALLRGEIPGGRFRLLPFLAEGARLLPGGLTVARKANKGYLAGARLADVRRWGERLFESAVRPRLGDRGAALVERERAAGRSIVLLTGMPEPLLEPFARHFAADFVLATPLAVTPEGTCTGRRAGPHPYGRAKLELARALAESRGWDPRACSAYGDHASDALLLAWVGHPFAVDPDPRLRREARRRGWTILEGVVS